MCLSKPGQVAGTAPNRVAARITDKGPDDA